jgi:uncharacterized protein (TIGR03083 family)
MRQLGPIMVIDLFPEILDELLSLLSGLSAEEWAKPTACPSWSVKDVALHLLGDDIGILSRQRDGFSSDLPIQGWEELVALINTSNETWVHTTRGISSRLLCELLGFTGPKVHEYLSSVDPNSIGGPVSWAGPDPAPVWLDLAREYTERWHHQQHIRDALDRPGLKQPRFFAPVLDTFVRALPHTYRGVAAVDGTLVTLTIVGDSGNRWSLLREGERWNLYQEISRKPDVEIVMGEEIAWRAFTRGLSRNKMESQVKLLGDQSLGAKILDTVSIIA